MNMRKYFLALCLLIVSVSCYSQSSIVTGVLLDSLTKESEPYATIRVFKSENRANPIAMGLSEEDGKFSQTIKGAGVFYITFNAVGRKEIVRRVELNASTPTFSLGTLLLQDNAQELSGVEVVAQKPLVKMETNKMTYDVQSDVDAKSNSVLDMLRKVPMVMVDGQDNITVNGSSSFKVYVDGKPNMMFSSNPSVIFKAIPATSVKSIEVITNPGVKYDAEGTGGILNFTMNKTSATAQSSDGYNGNISLSLMNHGVRSSAFLSGQSKKLTYSANASYSYMSSDKVEININRLANDGSMMNVSQTAKSSIPFVMGNLSLGYEIDSVSNLSLTLGMTRSVMNSEGHPMNVFKGGIYGNGFSFSNATRSKNINSSFNGSVDYSRFLNKERTKSITLSYLFTTNPGVAENERIYDRPSGQNNFPINDLYSEARTRGTEHTLQTDYKQPVLKNHSLNVGLKYISRNNTSDSKFFDIINHIPTYNENNSINYKNNQNIFASYIEYNANFGKIGAKAGARYEHTWEKVNYIVGKGTDLKRNYGNLVPSASITYNIAPTVNIGINYGMRISRPGITYLNPYVDRSNATILSYGNPDLEVEQRHNVSLVFNFFTPFFMCNMTLGQNFANNQIAEYSFLEHGILNTTYGNIIRSKWTNFSTFVNLALSKKTRITLNATMDYGDIRSDFLLQRNHGWQASVFIGLQQKLPWDLNWSLYTGGRTKRYTLQGYGHSFNMFTTTLAKSLLKDKLDVSLMYFVPLTGKLKLNNVSYGNDFVTSTKTIIPIQQINLTLTWRFGNTKQRYKQHKSKISNDFQEKKEDSGLNMGM